jgi:hypothetical protein
MIEMAQKAKSKPGVVPTFFMASYLKDVVFEINIFLGINLSWHMYELTVHVFTN